QVAKLFKCAISTFTSVKSFEFYRRLTASLALKRMWSAALGARFLGSIRCIDGRDILSFTIGAGLSRTGQNVCYLDRRVLALRYPESIRRRLAPFPMSTIFPASIRL